MKLKLIKPVLAQADGAGSPSNSQPVSSFFEQFNEKIGLNLGGEGTAFTDITIGTILSKLLPYLLIIAGLILLVMLIMGGFQLLTAANNPEKAEAGKKQLTNAVIGFAILFAAYWIAQILQVITGINFLNQ